MKKFPISACVIGFNEEKKVEDCLKSLLGIVDEIIFVDSGSTDSTVKIARKYTDKIFIQKFLGHSGQKNFAVSKAAHNWILSLDCDERLSETAALSIKTEWSQKTDNETVGYVFNRLTYYIYRWIRHSGWYPDRKLRLFHRDHCSWQGENPHDKVEKMPNSDKNVRKLKGDILHYSFDSISDHLRTIELFSSISAKEAHAKNRKSNILIIIGRSFWAGFRKLFLEFAFLDGAAGIILTGLSVAATWSKYSKLFILTKQKSDAEFCERNKI